MKINTTKGKTSGHKVKKVWSHAHRLEGKVRNLGIKPKKKPKKKVIIFDPLNISPEDEAAIVAKNITS